MYLLVKSEGTVDEQSQKRDEISQRVYKSCQDVEEALWAGGGHNTFFKDTYKAPFTK